MLDPQAVLGQAGQGRAPAGWRVFTKARGRVRGFLRGTSADPDPLLVITPDGVAEYVDSKKPIAVVDFDELAGISLRVSGSTFSDSIQVRLDVCSTCTTATAGNPSGARPRSLTGTRPSRRSSRPTAPTRHFVAACTRADPRPRHALVRHSTQPASRTAQTPGRRPTLPRWETSPERQVRVALLKALRPAPLSDLGMIWASCLETGSACQAGEPGRRVPAAVRAPAS